jgi:signal transduction histidine kinase
MGLGLWISFNIVREHGGTLTFTSEEGAGTCALVTLPAMPGQISESGGEAPRKGDA